MRAYDTDVPAHVTLTPAPGLPLTLGELVDGLGPYEVRPVGPSSAALEARFDLDVGQKAWTSRVLARLAEGAPDHSSPITAVTVTRDPRLG